MKIRYILLIIGVLGIIASIYGAIKGQEITTHLIGFICGASLIFGYFEFNNAIDENSKTN